MSANAVHKNVNCQGHMNKARRSARVYRVHPCNGHSAVASPHSNKCPNGHDHLRGNYISQGKVRHIIAELGLKTRVAACENIKSHPARIFLSSKEGSDCRDCEMAAGRFPMFHVSDCMLECFYQMLHP